MLWSEIWKIVASIIGGFGGIAIIFTAVVKYLSDIIADKLSKKYELQLSKELEKYKSLLENKTYISKTRFDTEFSIYRELSANFADAVKAVNAMIPSGFTHVPAKKEDKLDMDKRHYDIALPAVVKAQDSLKVNIPFIPENIYWGYNELLSLFRMQLLAYEDRFDVSDLRPQSEKEVFAHDDYKRTREINEKWVSLNNSIRDYLNTLDVVS